jgi:hypothetical protein
MYCKLVMVQEEYNCNNHMLMILVSCCRMIHSCSRRSRYRCRRHKLYSLMLLLLLLMLLLRKQLCPYHTHNHSHHRYSLHHNYNYRIHISGAILFLLWLLHGNLLFAGIEGLHPTPNFLRSHSGDRRIKISR